MTVTSEPKFELVESKSRTVRLKSIAMDTMEIKDGIPGPLPEPAKGYKSFKESDLEFSTKDDGKFAREMEPAMELISMTARMFMTKLKEIQDEWSRRRVREARNNGN
jgi:hypothetical protein